MILAIQGRKASAPLPPNSLADNVAKELSGALAGLLADSFAIYLKTKNFHWHVSGPHFRDYHLMLDEQAGQIFAMTDPIAERARKLGGTTLRSIGHISRVQRLLDNDADFVEPHSMLAELREDHRQLVAVLRQTHELCDEHGDIGAASLIEVWLDETEQRTWFLFETARQLAASTALALAPPSAPRACRTGRAVRVPEHPLGALTRVPRRLAAR